MPDASKSGCEGWSCAQSQARKLRPDGQSRSFHKADASLHGREDNRCEYAAQRPKPAQ